MNAFDVLVGKTIDRIQFDEQHLAFWSGGEAYRYEVEGDCCSFSYFYDFLGVRLLLEGGEVLSVDTVRLEGEGVDGVLDGVLVSWLMTRPSPSRAARRPVWARGCRRPSSLRVGLP